MIVENPFFHNVVKKEFAEEHNTEGTVRDNFFKKVVMGCSRCPIPPYYFSPYHTP
jgi:hypothetical protein